MSVTTWSQSVKAMAPASRRNPISVISRPARPLVSAAIWRMRTGQASAARRVTNSSVSGLSMAGCVSGRAMIVVTPPAAAASPAERKLSLCRSPGSPILTPRSTMPGARHLPPQSMMVAPLGAGRSPTPAIMPFSISRLPVVSVSPSGSIMRAFCRKRFIGTPVIGQARRACMSRIIARTAGASEMLRKPARSVTGPSELSSRWLWKSIVPPRAPSRCSIAVSGRIS